MWSTIVTDSTEVSDTVLGTFTSPLDLDDVRLGLLLRYKFTCVSFYQFVCVEVFVHVQAHAVVKLHKYINTKANTSYRTANETPLKSRNFSQLVRIAFNPKSYTRINMIKVRATKKLLFIPENVCIP